MLKRLFVVLGLCIALSVAARAQEYPKAEVFGGYSYGNFGPVISGAGRTNLNGWNASLGVNLNRWFGLVSDFGGHYGSFSAMQLLPILVPPCTPLTCGITTSETDKYHSFLFGPQFSFRTKKVTPFVHALFGGARFNRSGTTTILLPPPPLPPPFPFTFNFSTSTMNFAFAGGGGVDYKFTERLAWRVQADYLEIGIPNRTLNNIRVSTGLVIHF
jgi:opacity protein-like surface antigen